MVVSLFRYRDYIVTNAWNDLRHRYAGTGLGVVWNVLHPVATLLIFALVFGRIMQFRMPNLDSSEYAFVLYLCSGFLPWIAFSQTLSACTNIFITNSNFLRKLPIPEQVFMAQAALSGTLQMFLSLGLLVLLALLLGHSASYHWLYIFPVVLLLQGFAFGLGLILGTLNVFFRDIGQMLTVVLSMWMWLSPIVYVEEILPESFRTLIQYNPYYPFLRAIRDAFLLGVTPNTSLWGGMLAWSFGSVILGYIVLRALRFEIRDAL